MAPDRVVERVFARLDTSGECWTWSGANNLGYGLICWRENRRKFMGYTHRIAFEAYHGPIPDGLTVDHLCRTPACAHPHHLRLLTMSENARDSHLYRSPKTHCPQGHPYDDGNTYVAPNGHRKCRTCNRVRQAELRQRRRSAA